MSHTSRSHAPSSPGQWLGSVVAIAITLVVTVIVLQKARVVIDHVPMVVASREVTSKPGVTALLQSGGQTVRSELAMLDLVLDAGQPPDARLPDGKWEGKFTVTFLPGEVRSTRIGARMRGGSLIIMRNNDVVLSDYAGDEERIVLATVPLSLGRSAQQFKYIFNCDDRFDVRLQPLWQPEGAEAPQPLPLP